MLAVRSNERAAAAAAVNPRAVKLAAFTIAAFIAGVAGVLYAYNFLSVSADSFDAVTALSLIAFAYAGGISLISGAVFAGLLSAQALIPYALDDWFGLNGNWFLLVGGLLLIFTWWMLSRASSATPAAWNSLGRTSAGCRPMGGPAAGWAGPGRAPNCSTTWTRGRT
jgi:ABC-type branched-subunit amino acid transport system permease subunit